MSVFKTLNAGLPVTGPLGICYSGEYLLFWREVKHWLYILLHTLTLKHSRKEDLWILFLTIDETKFFKIEIANS